MPRTVTHHYEHEQLEAFQTQVGENGKAISDAIGYLSTWNLSFPFVDISIQGKPGDMELVASYRKTQPDHPGFIIAGIWNDGQFSFHS